MTFWQILALTIFSNILIITATYIGFYYGWMAKKEIPPVGIPVITNIVESFTTTDKKERAEAEDVQKSFFS